MAIALNKSRMRDSWIVGLIGLAVLMLCDPWVDYTTSSHEIMEYLGYFCVAVTAIGRVYCSAFLGGYKNQKLINYGPYSVVRNPLYTLSWIGFVGYGLVSGFVTLALLFGIAFWWMYDRLVKREEAFLREQFGNEYATYTKTVPRFVPNFALYHTDTEITLRPVYILNAVKDAIWWFVPFPVLELIEWLHQSGHLTAFALLP